MRLISQRTIRRLARRVWGTLFTLIIAIAVLVQLGREAFPLLDDYRNDISEILGKRLGVDIQVGGLVADWSGLKPKIILTDVYVATLQKEPIFNMSTVTAELGLIDSLLDFELRWHHLAFERFQATLKQAESGQWKIKNLAMKKTGESKFTIDDPLDIFLFGRRIQLNDVTFNLEYRTGHASVVNIPSITLENDRDFHRAVAAVGVVNEAGELDRHFQMVVEATGDPRDPDDFHSVGYLALKQFPMETVVAAFAGSHWEMQDDQVWGEGHRLDLELWFRGTTYSGMTLRGQLRSDGLPLDVPENVILPEGMAADISGRWHPNHGWNFVLQQMVVNWPEFQSPPLDVELRGGLKRPLAIAVEELDLKPWHDLTKKIGIMGEKPAGIINALAPEGRLHNIDIRLTGKDAGYFDLKAQLDRVNMHSFRGSPVVKKLNGFVSANALGGFVDIHNREGFSIAFPKVYAQPLEFETASGRVGWQIDTKTKTAYVNSNRLQFANGDEVANGYMHLRLPTVRDGREPHMTLAIGVEKAPLSVHRKFVPQTIPKNLHKWLGESIGEGTATNMAFTFHGSIKKNPKIKPSIQFSADIHDANLAFDKNWPELKHVNGRLELANNRLDAQVKQATLLGNQVSDAQVRLIENPNDDGMALSIRGDLKSNAAVAMELLQNSPVRSVFGSTFDSWSFGGNVSAAIALQIPLKPGAEGTRQSVQVDFNQARVNMADINLAIDKVSGRLQFDSDKGLSAPKLKGSVWGKALSARIESPLVQHTEGNKSEGKRNTVIHFTGPVNVADVRKWTHRPELGFVEGVTAVQGSITIPARNTVDHFLEVDLSSQLKGVSFQMPEPMVKTTAEEKPFNVNLRLHEGFQHYRFSYDESVVLRLQTGDAIESAAQLNIDAEPLPLQPGFFDVIGQVETFDIEEWDGVREQYFKYLRAGQTEEQLAQEETDLPIRLNLDIGQTNFGDVVVDDVRVSGIGTENEWALYIDSEIAAGNVLVTGEENKIELAVELDYFRIGEEASGEGEEQEAWALKEMDLSRFTFPIQFSVKELTLAGKPYGRWAFDLKPLEDGIALTNLKANVRGMGIGEAVQPPAPKEATASKTRTNTKKTSTAGRNKKIDKRLAFIKSVVEQPHAEFIWRQTERGNFSSFNGTLMAVGTGSLLEAWGFEKILDSEQTAVSARMSWPGAPDEINMQAVSGKVVFDIEDGSFIRGAKEADNGLLRLIALFNFDTIARRLQLDFSDMAKSGFGFESVHGEFLFENGWVYIHEPLVVDSTSSKLQMAGTLDLVEEKVDAELVATLPVAGDITVAAALIAGLPAAIGVFMISHMFEEQLDRASSINYRVTGNWDDPKIKFRKIFDDSAAKSKAKEVESLRKESAKTETVDPYHEPPEPTPIPD